MPGKQGFTSRAQQGLIFAKQTRGELPRGTATRMANETRSFKKLPAYAAKGGSVYPMSPDERKDRYPSEEYGGAVNMRAARGGVVKYAGVNTNPGRGPGGRQYAYGGTADGDEQRDRYPQDEYGGEPNQSYAEGGKVTCPACGEAFEPLDRMQPGFDDMDPETADREADMNLGHALLRKRDRGF